MELEVNPTRNNDDLSIDKDSPPTGNSGGNTFCEISNCPLLSPVLMSLIRNWIVSPTRRPPPKRELSVLLAVIVVGGIGFPNPVVASAGKNGTREPPFLLTINAAYGEEFGPGAVCPGLCPVFVTGGEIITPAAFALNWPLAKSTMPIAVKSIVSDGSKLLAITRLGPLKTSVPRTTVSGIGTEAANAGIENPIINNVMARNEITFFIK